MYHRTEKRYKYKAESQEKVLGAQGKHWHSRDCNFHQRIIFQNQHKGKNILYVPSPIPPSGAAALKTAHFI